MFALVQRSSTKFTYTSLFFSFVHRPHRSLRTLSPGPRTVHLSIPSYPRSSHPIQTQSESAFDAFIRPMSTTTFPNATTTQPDHDLDTQPAKKQKMNGTPKVRVHFIISSSLFCAMPIESRVLLTGCTNCGFLIGRSSVRTTVLSTATKLSPSSSSASRVPTVMLVGLLPRILSSRTSNAHIL